MPVAAWTQLFGDHFESLQLDTTKWLTSLPWGRTNSPELQYYAPDAFDLSAYSINRVVADRSTEYAGYNYTSGALTTYSFFSMQYGYFEIRAKMPSGQGLWPAFWLLAANQSSIAEIDVFEILGQQPNTVYMTNHWRDQGGTHRSNQGIYVGPDFSQAYHKFAVDWQPSQIIWYIDDVERFRSSQGVPSEPLNLILNLAVGGAWPGNPDSSTVFPAYLDINYVSGSQQTGGTATPVPTSTPKPMAPPAAPSRLTAAAASRNQINLRWTDNSSNETDFHIERSPNGSSGWTQIATVGANVTTYNNSGLTCGTRYYYRVRAHRHSDNRYSNYSSVAGTKTQACSRRTSAVPFALTAAPASHAEIALSWTNHSNGETGFGIERSPAGADEWMVVATAEKNVTGYLDGQLICSSIYDYRVRTLSPAGEEEYSDTATAATLSCHGETHLYLPLVVMPGPSGQ